MKPSASLTAALVLSAVALSAFAPGLSRAQAPAQAPQPTFAAPSGANLNISPKRITFDRNHRSGSIYIFNQGTGPGTFDISLVDRVMLPDGQILPLADAQAKPDTKVFADRLKSAQTALQVSPRRVTLNPGQGQTVRLRVISTGDTLPEAELRSHLTIAALPPRDSGTTAEAAAANAPSGELRFQINALLGLSIPAIVRLGDLDMRAGVENARIEYLRLGDAKNTPLSPVLTLELVRLGANSLFGNIEVRAAGQPRSAAIGTVRGVGVYTEIDRRTVRIPLSRPPAPGEHLDVTFTDDDTSPGKLLAKFTL